MTESILKLELEFKPGTTPEKIKAWVEWETVRIKREESYPTLIYIALVEFLVTGKSITGKEALRIKLVLGSVITRRRVALNLTKAGLARIAQVAKMQATKLERGQAAVSAYGAVLLSLETYAALKGSKLELRQEADKRLREMMSGAPQELMAA